LLGILCLVATIVVPSFSRSSVAHKPVTRAPQLAAASPSLGGRDLSKFTAGGIRRGGPAPQTVVDNSIISRTAESRQTGF
jgi:hypothetical protein